MRPEAHALPSVEIAKALARFLRPALPSHLTMRRRGDVITLTVVDHGEADSGAEQAPSPHPTEDR